MLKNASENLPISVDPNACWKPGNGVTFYKKENFNLSNFICLTKNFLTWEIISPFLGSTFAGRGGGSGLLLFFVRLEGGELFSKLPFCNQDFLKNKLILKMGFKSYHFMPIKLILIVH